jgi:hypothetical protein
MNNSDEFYIGWERKAPRGIGRQVRSAVLIMLGFAVALGILLAVAQRTIGVSVFEWGTVKHFSGIFRSQPYPHLLVPRPGARGDQTPFSSYHLVKPFKSGLDSQIADRFEGKAVNLKGTLIYRDNQTMIEVVDGSIQTTNDSALLPANASVVPVHLGRQTLIGEIVDSKCFLGVMNPGALVPHRACAIRCISGGIPPVLLVRQTNGPALYFLLTSREGKPVNKQVLNLVAEPVEINGDVERHGDLLILRADPASYRRVMR